MSSGNFIIIEKSNEVWIEIIEFVLKKSKIFFYGWIDN